jgi:opacity protein-like surface antigen
LALAATEPAKLAGSIWDNAEEEYNNYTYRYKLQHAHVAVKGQLLAQMGWAVTPWLSGSVGIGFNRAFAYTNVATIFAARANNNFQSNTETAFTYTLGAGIQKALNNNWEIGIGYEFADWGKSTLHRAVNQTAGSGLALNHLYTNGIQFNITWLA